MTVRHHAHTTKIASKYDLARIFGRGSAGKGKVSLSASTAVGAAHEFQVDRKLQPTHNRHERGRFSPYSYRTHGVEALSVKTAPYTSVCSIAC